MVHCMTEQEYLMYHYRVHLAEKVNTQQHTLSSIKTQGLVAILGYDNPLGSNLRIAANQGWLVAVSRDLAVIRASGKHPTTAFIGSIQQHAKKARSIKESPH